MAEQIQRTFVKKKRQKAVILKAALLESRKMEDEFLIDQDMVDISKRNAAEKRLSMVEGARFFSMP